MFVDVQRPQVRIVQQPLRLQVDRRLAAALVAQRPLRIDEAPERRAGDAVVRPPFLPANRVYYYKKKQGNIMHSISVSIINGQPALVRRAYPGIALHIKS